jgi:large subunit ribosomal protein L24e
MQRISEIRQKRERAFYKKRMEGNKEKERAANRKLVAENQHLLPKMRASEKRALEEAGLDAGLVEAEPQPEKTKVFGKQRLRKKLVVEEEAADDDEMEWD